MSLPLSPPPPTTNTTNTTVNFTVHSTFRDANNRKLKPRGLEWDLAGLSEICYVPYPPTTTSNSIDLTLPHIKGIVEAHNRWSFAKDLPYVNVNDVDFLEISENHYVTAKWKKNGQHFHENTSKHGGTISDMLQKDRAAADNPIAIEGNEGVEAAAEVYLNGAYISTLSGQSTLPPILDAINNSLQSKKVCYRRSSGLIRIERYFQGMIHGIEIFDHLLDNLYAMEDAEVLDKHTMIGTVTLPDWIMGGMLTSRLWMREKRSGNILTMRPLYNDDLDTSDRRYELRKGKDDDRIALVRAELCRLRYLAQLEHHPMDVHISQQEGRDGHTKTKLTESSIMKQHRFRLDDLDGFLKKDRLPAEKEDNDSSEDDILEQSTENALEIIMEATNNKEEDDDPSPFLEEGDDDDGECSVSSLMGVR